MAFGTHAHRKATAMDNAAPRAHVLVVNDTQTILDVMRDLLEDAGYRVSTSIETVELSRIKELQPDVIVQDLLFAGTHEVGWHFLTLARLDPELARIPIILCTAAIETIKDPDMAENLNRLGVRVILKPFNLDDLLGAIADVLAAQAIINQARAEDPAGEA
jgi:CheY-like chemotaxis protein